MGKLPKNRSLKKAKRFAPNPAPVFMQKNKFSLDEERYLSTDGKIHLTGIQALVRLPFDNLRLLKKIFPDKSFAYFISGYEGSPLGGLDINLKKIYPILKKWKIIHLPAGNEEAGANMVWGSQLHRLFGPSKVDGIIGAWYGKGPGVRRISDVADHMQMAGLDKLCASYFMSGDDHTSKSSTTPHQTDYVHFANHVPTAYPGNIQEILEVGKKATLASLISGLAVNLKVETYVCDGSQEFSLNSAEDLELAEKYHKFVKEYTDYKRHFSPILLKPSVLKNEEELFYSKLPMMQKISRYFGWDVWKNRQLNSDFGIVTTGKSYFDLMGALARMGIGEDEIEIYKPMFTWPPDTESCREFARGKKQIIIIEEKRSFFENHIKNEFFNDPNRPIIIGKNDEKGNTLFRQNNNFDSDYIVQVLGRILAKKNQFKGRGIERTIRETERIERLSLPSDINVKRPPAYCSGCQHRTALEISGHDNVKGTADSIVVENKDLDGKRVQVEITPKHLMGIGIGCSTMSIIDTLASNRAIVVGPMESEGLLWMGASAFSFRAHADQGCGDGTYFHSARLNISFIRDAIEHLKVHYDIDDTHQTLLYVDNSVVAMTGGQRPVGQDDPEIAIANIKREGIEHIALVAEFPEEFKHLKKKYGIEVYHKSDTLKVKEEFSKKSGLGVIWYVQKCGIEKVRERREFQDLAPKTRVHVNPEVCENCGDCGLKAKCASVWQTDTEFGPKVKIHQFSCIQDFSCAKGDCPSYVKVHTRSGSPFKKFDLAGLAIGSEDLPHPERVIDPDKIFKIYSVGIGGWGLMTAYEILARAASMEGKHVVKEDDTGLSQKGGEVRNSLKISYRTKKLNEGFKIEIGGADLYMASDLIGAVNPENLKETAKGKTRAIVNTEKVPTMPMIVGKEKFPDRENLLEIINDHSTPGENIHVNATEIVETLFKDFKPTNLFLLGLAYQTIKDFPVENAGNIENAIFVNNVEIEKNIQAFRYGRLYAVDPERVLSLIRSKKPTVQERIKGFEKRLGGSNGKKFAELVRRVGFDEEFPGIFAREIYELIRFQNAKYAEDFVNFVDRVAHADKEQFPDRNLAFSRTVADNLYDVMAYKDEYRVAELLTRPEEIQKIQDQYEKGEITKIRFLLRPPLLRYLPWVKDLKIVKEKFEKDEKWEVPGGMLTLLKHFKFLRGTIFDFLAWGNKNRTEERRAISIYKQRIEGLVSQLSDKNYPLACEAASYPGLATGYEKVKEIHNQEAEEFWEKKWSELTDSVPTGQATESVYTVVEH